MENSKKSCSNCFFNNNGYCKNSEVMIWDRGGYASFGVVSIANYQHTNCQRDGEFLGVQFPRVPKFWKAR